MAEVYIHTVDELNQLIEAEKEDLKAEVVKLREDIKHLQSKNSDLMVKGYRIQYERDEALAEVERLLSLVCCEVDKNHQVGIEKKCMDCGLGEFTIYNFRFQQEV